MKTDTAGIYVDLAILRKTLRIASYEMTRKDRIIYVDSDIQLCGDCIRDFVLAYRFKDERAYYTRKLVADFELLKIDLRFIAEEAMFKGARGKNGVVSVEREVFETIARIDEGIGRWVNAGKGKSVSVEGTAADG